MRNQRHGLSGEEVRVRGQRGDPLICRASWTKRRNDLSEELSAATVQALLFSRQPPHIRKYPAYIKECSVVLASTPPRQADQPPASLRTTPCVRNQGACSTGKPIGSSTTQIKLLEHRVYVAFGKADLYIRVALYETHTAIERGA